ncbi:hypothetical protein ACQ4M3_13215 [Leptolyngbya sp. AN03gr2]|uniref:hypothetical protein n=1 Tax=unclassified Leptolyngbya TaxID=2650499 RepID=UPI003D30F62A
MTKQGNPNWKPKYNETTKPVRLPESTANKVQQELKAGVPIADIPDRVLYPKKCQLTLTLCQAIAVALRINKKPLSVQEIWKTIVEEDLYQFGGETIESQQQSLRGQLRRHCEGLNFKSALPEKYFVINLNEVRGDTRYWLLDEPIKLPDPLKVAEETALSAVEVAIEEYRQRFQARLIDSIERFNAQCYRAFVSTLVDSFGLIEGGVIEQIEQSVVCAASGELGNMVVFVRRDTTPMSIREFYSLRGMANFNQSHCGIIVTLGTISEDIRTEARKPRATQIALYDRTALAEHLMKHRIGMTTVPSRDFTRYTLDWAKVYEKFEDAD